MLCVIFDELDLESPVDIARPPTVWGMHVSVIKRGSLMLTQQGNLQVPDTP